MLVFLWSPGFPPWMVGDKVWLCWRRIVDRRDVLDSDYSDFAAEMEAVIGVYIREWTTISSAGSIKIEWLGDTRERLIPIFAWRVRCQFMFSVAIEWVAAI
mmetsp:Transcript_3555/g.7848  ORF Transcript_3555/g.7848 Transcript_3555/m.7848 type:complete len:101 (+) Transcript_3555:647-949(+)